MRNEVPFEKRAAEAHRIRTKYPNRIPVICERAPRCDLPDIDKKKFLVPMNMMVGEFKYIVHKHINQCAMTQHLQGSQGFTGSGNGGTAAAVPITHEKTIYLFVNNTAPKAGALMQELYEEHVAEDGFLYVEYAAENTLGMKQRSQKADTVLR